MHRTGSNARIREEQPADPRREQHRAEVVVPDAALLLDRRRLDHALHPPAHAAEQERPARDAQGVSRVPPRVEACAERAGVGAPELVCAGVQEELETETNAEEEETSYTYTEERNGDSLRSRSSSKLSMCPSPNMAI